MKHTIVYIDLDGVMVDLYTALWEKMQFRFPEKQSENRADIDAMWMQLAEEHPRFWMELQPMPYAQELYSKILELDPSPHFLSATPQPYVFGKLHDECAYQKRYWILENFAGGEWSDELWYKSIITKSKLKQWWVTAKPSAERKILVDDHPGNIKRWIEAGGIGVHHTDINKTLAELEALKQA